LVYQLFNAYVEAKAEVLTSFLQKGELVWLYKTADEEPDPGQEEEGAMMYGQRFTGAHTIPKPMTIKKCR